MALRLKAHVRTDVPNLPQRIPLRLVHPSLDNCRLFVERESLAKLRQRYRDFNHGKTTVLPDPPILRLTRPAAAHTCAACAGNGYDLCENNTQPALFEILAGERRVTSATMEHVEALPSRVVQMTDEEAYRFILEHNNVAGLTTVELAFRAAEMDRLGFSHDDIADALDGASVNRYLTVGALVNPDWFSDTPKLCDPSIVEWFEAAQFGGDHLAKCFQMWNSGVWGEKECAREFRKRGKALPQDNAEKGFRVTFDVNRFIVRGQLDIDIVPDREIAQRMLYTLNEQIREAMVRLSDDEHFGLREVHHINPITCAPDASADEDSND